MPEEVLDILLRLSNLRGFVAGSREAAASVRSVGTAAREGSAEASVAGRRMSGVAGLASKAWKGTAVAAAAFAYESTKMAVSFDQQMEMVHTQAGASQKEVHNLSREVLAFASSGQTMQGPQTLAEGLFHLESIGLRGAGAMNALRIAAQGAAVGNANLEDTTTALGSAWLAQIKGGGDLNNVMALMNATVGAGNMRMQDLVTSLGTGVLPAAKLAHLSIKDVFGALAILSDEGWRGSSAMAQFATSLHYLTDPTQKAKKALAELGLTSLQLSGTMSSQGLPATLRLLRSRLAGFSVPRQEQILGDILPAGRGRVLEVLMNQVDRYSGKINQISHTSNHFAEDVAATHRTAAFRIHAAWSQIQADMIHVGHLLEPVAVALAVGLAHLVHWLILMGPSIARITPYLLPLVAGFVAYRAAVLGAAAAEAIMAGGAFLMAIATLIPEIKSLRDAWILLDLAMDANPIFIVIAAIVAIGVAIVIAYKKFAWFRNGVNAIWSAMKSAAHAFVVAIVASWNWMGNAAASVVAFIRHNWRPIIAVLLPGLGLAIDFVTAHWGLFSAGGRAAWRVITAAAKFAWNSVLKPVFNSIVSSGRWSIHMLTGIFRAVAGVLSWPFRWAWNNVIKPVANWIVGAFRWVANEVTKLFHKITGPISTVTHFLGHVGGSVGKFLGVLPGAQAGGTVMRSGLVRVGEGGPEILHLPMGAQVRPLRSSSTAATTGVAAGLTLVIPVQIDGREVARATGKYVDDRLARQ